MENRTRFGRLAFAALAATISACGTEAPESAPLEVIASRSVSVTALTASPTTSNEGTSVSLSGGTVTALVPDTDLTLVEVRWGETDPATGLEFRSVVCQDGTGTPCGASETCGGFSHVYHDSLDRNGATVGDFTITCYGENGATGASGTATDTITVDDTATNVDAEAAAAVNAYTVQEDSPLLPSATFTDASMDGATFYETYNCAIQWGDLTPDSMQSGCTPATLNTSHTYVNDGVFTMTVLVTNTQADAVAQTGPNTATVTVTDHQPAITAIVASPDPATERQQVSFSATATASTFEPIQSCSWDWGDGSPLENEPDCVAGLTTANVIATHTYADGSGAAVTVRLLVDDADSQSVGTKALTVNNDAAVVTNPTANPTTIIAFQPVTYSSSLADSPDSPWTADWDFDYDGATFNVDATQTVNTAGAFSINTTAPAPGTYRVAVRVTDNEGAAAIAESTFDVFGAPAITAVNYTGIVSEGTAAAVDVDAVDGNSPPTPLTYSFDWNSDGCLAPQGDVCGSTLDNASHFYGDIGTYTLTITVTNGVGLTATEVRDITVTDAIPEITAISNSSPKAEGQAVTVHTELAAAAGDTYTIDYAWGDTTTSPNCGRVCSHSYGDQGSYLVTVTVTDDEGNSTQGTSTASVTNAAPVAANACGATAPASGAYSCDLDASDVAADTVTFSLVLGPAGMTVDAGTGVISWTPTADQSRDPDSFQVSLRDEDGGESYYSRSVSHMDADADGLSDRWEAANGITDPNGDADGDGRTNAQEYANGTDPNVFDGPNDPVAKSPANGAESASASPALRIRNASDPEGDPLTYTFEVFGDAGLTTLVASTSGLAEGAIFADGVYHTEWTVNVALSQNTEYWWRARGNDGGANGANSAVASFFVNSANDAPGMPSLSAPQDGTEVPTLFPTLEIGNASDVDRDALTYTFEVATSAAFTTIVASQSGVAPGNGTTSWVVDTALTDNTTYFWRARAVDPDAMAGPDLPAGSFFVNTTNNPPSTVALQGPADGAEVASLTPSLSVANATDLDGDVLVYEFELDTSPAFSAPISSGAIIEGGAGQTSFTPAALTENTEYYWRARAFDGTAGGDWASGSFFVNATNDPPGQPVAQNPVDGSLVDRTTVRFSLRNTSDPDRDAVSYVFTIWKDEAMTVQHEQSSPIAAGAGGETSFTPTVALSAGKSYWWTATAQDDSALQGTASVAQQFKTVGGGGGGGCAISAGNRGTPASLLLLLGLFLVRTRRRKS